MIKIREASKEDVETLYELILDIARYHNQEQFVYTNTKEMLTAGFVGKPKYGALIAELNGQTAGYLSYTWNYSIWEGADYMNVDDLYVRSQYRGKKIGFHLMQNARSICIDKEIRLIRWEAELNNNKATKFYTELGARKIEKGIFRWSIK